MSLLTGVCISFLNSNTFWMSLTVFGLFFMATVFVIRQSEILIKSNNQKSNNQKFHYRSQITDHLKWTLHMWEGAGKHLRLKHNGLKSHPLRQRLLWGGGGLPGVDQWSLSCKQKFRSFNWKYTWSSLKSDSVSGKMHQILAQAFNLKK